MSVLAGWPFRKKITIPFAKVPTTQANMVFLVVLSATNFDFTKTTSDGRDIRFTASDGTTLLNHKKIFHDVANQLAQYDVQIPSASSLADTEFYIYFTNDNSKIDTSTAATYESSVKLALHMADNTTSQILDNSPTGAIGTKGAANLPLGVASVTGRGQSGVNASDIIMLNKKGTIIPDYPFTIVCTGKITAYPVSVQGRFFAFRIWVAGTALSLILGTDGTVACGFRDALFIYDGTTLKTSAISLNTLYTFTITYDGAVMKLYVDENSPISKTTSFCGFYDHNLEQDWEIGIMNFTTAIATNGLRTGVMDEMIVFNTAKSADWIKTFSYNVKNNILTYSGIEFLMNRRWMLLQKKKAA
jgi:hypothetical protein